MAKKKQPIKKTTSRSKAKPATKRSAPSRPSSARKSTPAPKRKKTASGYKGTKLNRYQYKKAKKQYRATYMRHYRKVQKVKELDKGTVGYKSKKSALFAEIIDINKELRHTGKKLGMKPASEVKPKIKKPVRDVEKKTVVYTERIWEFEGVLRAYIQNKAFKTIININTGETFKVTKSRETAIMFSFDKSKEIAYSKTGATTPYVEVTEDYGNSILSFEALS